MRLYSTDGCHLCEQATALCRRLNITVTVVDIMDNTQWQQRYGCHIPVLADGQGRELYWPFNEQQLKDFVWPQC